MIQDILRKSYWIQKFLYSPIKIFERHNKVNLCILIICPNLAVLRDILEKQEMVKCSNFWRILVNSMDDAVNILSACSNLFFFKNMCICSGNSKHLKKAENGHEIKLLMHPCKKIMYHTIFSMKSKPSTIISQWNAMAIGAFLRKLHPKKTNNQVNRQTSHL